MTDSSAPAPVPPVSLVMATWNGAAWLGEQLDSLVRQSLHPAELIVSDDGSDDGTVGLLREFAASSPFPVRLFEQPRRAGFARNFAGALAHVSGELVMLADQDDIWLPHKVERMAQAAAASGAGLLVHDCEVILSDGEVLLPSLFGQVEQFGLPRAVCVKGCCLALRRGFLDQWGLPPAGHGITHDFWLAFLAAATGDQAFVDERLIRHRLHGANASGWIPSSADRAPALADLAEDAPPGIAALLETFLKPWRRRWIAPLQAALRERALPAQAEAAERAIRMLAEADRRLARMAKPPPLASRPAAPSRRPSRRP